MPYTATTLEREAYRLARVLLESWVTEQIESSPELTSELAEKLARVKRRADAAAPEPLPEQHFDWDKELVAQAHSFGAKSVLTAVITELQTKPGEWATLYSNVSSSMARHYQRRGVKIAITTLSPGRCVMYGQWPAFAKFPASVRSRYTSNP